MRKWHIPCALTIKLLQHTHKHPFYMKGRTTVSSVPTTWLELFIRAAGLHRDFTGALVHCTAYCSVAPACEDKHTHSNRSAIFLASCGHVSTDTWPNA